jgi:hypothetical protein
MVHYNFEDDLKDGQQAELEVAKLLQQKYSVDKNDIQK